MPAEQKPLLFSNDDVLLFLQLLKEANQVSVSVIDIDIDHKALLDYANDEEGTLRLQRQTHHDALKVASVCNDMDIPVLLEDSGYKGRHLLR